jgi:hypothetical protein
VQAAESAQATVGGDDGLLVVGAADRGELDSRHIGQAGRDQLDLTPAVLVEPEMVARGRGQGDRREFVAERPLAASTNSTATIIQAPYGSMR